MDLRTGFWARNKGNLALSPSGKLYELDVRLLNFLIRTSVSYDPFSLDNTAASAPRLVHLSQYTSASAPRPGQVSSAKSGQLGWV